MWRIEPSQSNSCQPVYFGKCTSHRDVFKFFNERSGVLKFRVINIFQVCRIQYQQYIFRQSCVQLPDFPACQPSASGIVRVGNHHDTGAFGDATQNPINICSELIIRRQNRHGIVGKGIVWEFLVSVDTAYQFIPRSKKCPGQSGQQIIRAIAAYNSRGIKRVVICDMSAQRDFCAIRVSFHATGTLNGNRNG